MEREKLTVLVVDDQHIDRQILSGLISLEYNVLEAENGKEAFEKLDSHHEIAAILLDIVMPVMNGYEFLKRFKKSEYSMLPIIAMTGEKDDNTEQNVLNLGAWDFVPKPYQPATLMSRLKNVIIRSQYYLVSRMKYASEHDSLTDLLNRSTFFQEVGRLLENNRDTKFAMVRVDIDQFQTYNSFWGEEEGDKLLIAMANRLRRIAQRNKLCVYGRINADAFCICVPDDEKMIKNEAKMAFDELAVFNKGYRLVPSIGVYEVRSFDENPQKMYELATLASRECKGSYFEYLSFYKTEMSAHILKNQWIVNEMQHAIDDEQFEVFLQPKYELVNEKPYGAEALIRWRHPEKGLLSPGVFIPVFEQNGFIGKIDYYMWEHVCQLLRKWIDEGRDPEPVSVNVSRVNLYNQNLVNLFSELVKKYDIPAGLLHLEMTESAYMANPQIMERVVKELQARGFVILMDDFGSGYSSLNTLKDIKVDVLKIDMKFLSGNSNVERSRSILGSVILMAGWLETPVIMEGVETAEQVEFLKSIGCNYVQGFYYAKPMPVSDYEELIRGIPQKPTQMHSENLKEIIKMLWSSDPFDELIFNALNEPAAICEYKNASLHILRKNQSFNCMVQSKYEYGKKNEIHNEPDSILEENCDISEALKKCAEKKSISECVCSFENNEGKRQSYQVKLKFLGMNETANIIFAQFFEIL